MGNDPAADAQLLERTRAGDPAARNELFARHRARLWRMVDRRLAGRVDPSDVIQDGLADAVGKLPEYLADPRVPLFL